MQDLKINKNKIEKISLGVNYKDFANLDKNHPNFQHIKDKYNLPEKYLLFMATLEPRKNLELVLESFCLLQNENSALYLVLAGQQTSHSRKLLKRYKNLSDKILVLNYLDEADKKYLYALAQVMLYPSFYEGFGLPPLEAMAANCPVIVGRNSALLENFAEYLPTVDVHSAAELKDLICYTIDNRVYYQEKMVKIDWLEFSWENYAKKYLKKICELE